MAGRAQYVVEVERLTKQDDIREGMIARLDQILISCHIPDHREQAERVIDEKFLPYLGSQGVVLKTGFKIMDELGVDLGDEVEPLIKEGQ